MLQRCGAFASSLQSRARRRSCFWKTALSFASRFVLFFLFLVFKSAATDSTIERRPEPTLPEITHTAPFPRIASRSSAFAAAPIANASGGQHTRDAQSSSGARFSPRSQLITRFGTVQVCRLSSSLAFAFVSRSPYRERRQS